MALRVCRPQQARLEAGEIAAVQMADEVGCALKLSIEILRTLFLFSTCNYIRLSAVIAGAILWLEANERTHLPVPRSIRGDRLLQRTKIMLTLLKARRIVNQALLRARELNVSISVAVCDTRGRLIALNQMDGSVGWEVDRCSMGKAVAAAITGRPSDRLFEQFGTGWPRLSSCNNVVPPRGQRGGLPVVEAGIIQGGCGVSGAPTPEQDEECARAGIATEDHLDGYILPSLEGSVCASEYAGYASHGSAARQGSPWVGHIGDD